MIEAETIEHPEVQNEKIDDLESSNGLIEIKSPRTQRAIKIRKVPN